MSADSVIGRAPRRGDKAPEREPPENGEASDHRALLAQALDAVEQMQEKLAANQRAQTEPVAIIGIGCRFPGGVESAEQFWDLLAAGRNAVTRMPAERWSGAPDAAPFGGFLEHIDRFDADFFGIAPREAASMDPQQRLVLEVAWEALEHAGVNAGRLRGSQTGIFIGATTTDYGKLALRGDPATLDAYTATGNALNVIAGRVAYLLGLNGPAMAVDTACSSSIVAVHLACHSLRSRECDLALAGGVNALIAEESFICFERWGMMSPKGQCRAFDANADGFVRAEGCGVVALKRLSDAERDGDAIVAVIRSSAVNQDGASSGLTVPNGLAQQAVIRRALEAAKIDAGQIGYVEAHGTGTNIGDPIELEAIGTVLCRNVQRKEPLRVGSVKSNLGHMESAAGIGGLIKAALCLEREAIPRSLHFEQPNPRIDWQRYPVEVPTRMTAWARGATPRLAAVSGFGFSGTNGHVILQESPPSVRAAERASPRPSLLCISARTPGALDELSDRYIAALESLSQSDAGDICATANRRVAFAARASVVGSSAGELAARLRANREEGEASAAAPRATDTEISPGFLFTGQGSQYPGMGSELYEHEPVFRAAVDRCTDILRTSLELPIRDVMFNDRHSRLLNQTLYTQPALFTLEWALAELWRAWGIVPNAVLGHSVGEYVAACVAGVMPLEDGLALLARRAQLMHALPPGGGMTSILAPEAQILELLDEQFGELAIAAVNSPASAVVSGPSGMLEGLERELQARSITFARLDVSHAFHSRLMEPMLDAFRDAARNVRYREPGCRMLSNVTGRPAGPAEIDAEYWVQHVRKPVRFADCVQHLRSSGTDLLVEIGPSPVLLALARQCPGAAFQGLPSLRTGKGAREQMLESLGAAWVAGCQPNLAAAAGERVGTRLHLPTYPFQRKRHWLPAAPRVTASTPRTRSVPDADVHPWLGSPVSSPLREIQYECTVDLARAPVLREHRIAGTTIFPAAAFIELGSAAARERFGTPTARIEGGWLRAALLLDEEGRQDIRLVVTPRDGAGSGPADFEVFSRPWSDAPRGPWTSHAGGRLSRWQAAPDPGVLPDEARARCRHGVDLEPWRVRIAEVGLEYGPTFRSLVTACRGEREAWGELRLPAEDALAHRLGAHPGLLDSAFHLIGIALPDTAEERFYLPVGFEAVEVAGQLGPAAQAHVALRVADERQVIADVSLWREDGELALRVVGLQARPVTAAQFQSAIGVAGRTELMRLDWRPAPEATLRETGRWLLLGGTEAVAAAVAEGLRSAGAKVDRVPGSAVESAVEQVLGGNEQAGIVDLRALPTATGGVEHPLAELASEAARAGLEETLSLLRQLAAKPPAAGVRLVLPTLGGQCVVPGDRGEPAASALWSLGVTAAAEVPGLEVRLLDLERIEDAASGVPLAALRGDAEDRLALRGGQLHGVRLVPAGAPAPGSLALPSGAYELVMASRGTLDGLGVEARTRRTPGPGEVEIEVLASGLNFRDVLNLLDMYPGPAGPLGNECSGRVTAVGEGVERLQVGDLVCCIADATFASHVIAPAALTFAVPAQLSVTQAAAFPIAQLTAYQALHRVGAIEDGERVLVHAGAGGVGLAAVHLAMAAGAQVYASAGSEAKRAYLRSLGVRHVFDSRNPASAAEMLSVTGPDGFDLVLNSLTGTFIDEGLRALAPGGRFLEIGLREVRSPEAVAAIRDDVAYHPLLLGDLCRENPQAVGEMYAELMGLLASGRIPAPRTRAFPIAHSPEAFRFMAQARQVGRVAITHPAPALPRARADAAYLVTGGLGALGLHVAEWLAQQGAGEVVLVGRSAPAEEAAERIALIEAGGTRVQVVRGDVADGESLAFLSDPARPPLRGIVHAAGVTEDAVLSRVDGARLERALRPKADGALSLVRLAEQVPPEFLVFFSSASALLGSPGQGAYAAANGFLDGMAERLRADGIPAVSIAWGAFEGGGMAAHVDERTEREWKARGVGMLSPEEGLRLLGEALSSGLGRAAAIPMNWTRFFRSLGRDRTPALLRELAPAADETAREATQVPQASSLREQIRALAPHERMAALTQRLEREIAAVMGIQAEEQELAAGLMERGMDSLMAVELSGRLGRLLGVSLPTTFVFEYPTLPELATHLLASIVDDAADGSATAAPDAPSHAEAELAPELDDLSDDELEAELRRELDQAGF